MFTGLVEQIGILSRRSGNRIDVQCDTPFHDLIPGESIAVNGCCLTLETVLNDGLLRFFTLDETLSKTALGQLAIHCRVNLERAMSPGKRFGGHLVQGHVDTTGSVKAIRKNGADTELTIHYPEEFAIEVVSKGSIAIDGVSLTVAKLDDKDSTFTVCLIPETLQRTALADLQVNSPVNLEFDIIGKYVIRQSALRKNDGQKSAGVTWDKLNQAGFL